MKIRIGIVAGEASGDLLGARLIHSLRARRSDIEFVGIAGPKMQAAGALSLFPMEKLSVRGYVEVLRHLPELLSIRRRLVKQFLRQPPALFIGVDAPDFNLGLEASLKAGGIPTVQYIAPAVWAWRPERVQRIARSVTRILSIFPFEAKIFASAGVPVSYVGHPLADLLQDLPDQPTARARLQIAGSGAVVALLPGSRQSELELHAPLFVATAKAIARRAPDTAFLVPLATAGTRAQFAAVMQRDGARALSMILFSGRAHEVLAAADVALVASGTASLEAALIGCPAVITYRLAPLSYRIVQAKRHSRFVGLPNIIAGEYILPEILQDDATAENLSQALSNLLEDAPVRARLAKKFSLLRHLLAQDSDAKIAAALLPLLQTGGPIDNERSVLGQD